MKSEQVVLVLCVIISSPCLGDDNQNTTPNLSPVIFLPSAFGPYIQEYWQGFQNYISQGNIVLPQWFGGLGQPTKNSSASSDSTSENNSQPSSTTPGGTTQEQSKVKGHPAARHSHKDVKNKHSHGKKHHQGEKHNKHERHHEHAKHKPKNKHEN